MKKYRVVNPKRWETFKVVVGAGIVIAMILIAEQISCTGAMLR